jgi:hypothetical protein
VMTKERALRLVQQYAAVFRTTGEWDTTLTEIADRWPEDGSEQKAMRWLGFVQGVAYARGLFTLEEIKEHSMTGRIVR